MAGGGRWTETDARIPVSLVKAEARGVALRGALALLDPPIVAGKDIYLKGDFNSADTYPATTHPETLRLVVGMLREGKCGRIFLAERSGMGETKAIWERLGITSLARELGVILLSLDDLAAADWRREDLPESHWRQGIEVPRFLNRHTCVVQLCNLKTHRFGGQFSASLKNSIGLIAKYAHSGSPYNYMEELHGSPNQRLMIAEVNQVYQPLFLLMDAMQVFVDGGPETGKLSSPGVFMASRDRVALDAAGVALLRHHGAGSLQGRSRVFELEQLKRAAELKLGATSGNDVHLVSNGGESNSLAALLTAILNEASPKDNK
jgi:uncharacterized protein (DUF362 family)